MLYWSVYILKITDKKCKLNIIKKKKSQLDYQIKLIPEWNVFKLLIMFIYFLGVKLCTFNVLHHPSSFQHYDRSHYSFRCNIESNILHENISLFFSMLSLQENIISSFDHL